MYIPLIKKHTSFKILENAFIYQIFRSLNHSESNLYIWMNFPCVSLVSMNQNVTHGFNVFISIIRWTSSLVSTRVIVIKLPSCTKANPGVAGVAFILVVSSDADSRFGVMRLATHNIKSFLVTVKL